ncbi:MAG: hypothetical protein AAF682_09935 [Planctomycetota bacterium]
MPSIPVTILGGSDLKPSALPERGAELHALAAYKGAALRVGDRPLVVELLDRLAAAGFGPFAIAGPERVYGPLDTGARIIETDSTVADNLRAAFDDHLARRDADQPYVGILACDVLPSVAELRDVRARFEAACPCALWFPFVPVPDERERLGVFGWKPLYRLVPEGERTPQLVLPGHLALLDPAALRLGLLYRLMDCAYRTRNRSIGARRAALVRTGFGRLLAEDARLALRLRLPNRTWTVLLSGLRVAARLRGGELEQLELEDRIGRIFLHRPAPPRRGIRYPVVECFGLAADADTHEEARELERRFAAPSGGESPR